MTAFKISDSATWPAVLTAEETAAIYRRSVGGLKKACQRGVFVPAPFQQHPWRWRRVDLIRHLEGQRTSLRRVS